MFMFIRRELGGTDTGCLFQFTYCVGKCIGYLMKGMWYHINSHISVHRLCISETKVSVYTCSAESEQKLASQGGGSTLIFPAT